MPTDWQSLVIYAIVAVTLYWLGRRLFRRRIRPRSDCGQDCGCGADGLKRDPAIQRFLDRRQDKEND